MRRLLAARLETGGNYLLAGRRTRLHYFSWLDFRRPGSRGAGGCVFPAIGSAGADLEWIWRR